jgi:hypothetical protein
LLETKRDYSDRVFQVAGISKIEWLNAKKEYEDPDAEWPNHGNNSKYCADLFWSNRKTLESVIIVRHG